MYNPASDTEFARGEFRLTYHQYTNTIYMPTAQKHFQKGMKCYRMVKIPKPPNFDEIKKRGSTDRHIVKRVADTASPGGLDSDGEDNILDEWIENVKSDEVTRFQPYQGHYPAISNNRLQDYILTYKEVELGGYRIDSIVRHPEGTWELIEVKTEGGLGLGVFGHLLSKRANFEDIFRVNSRNVEMTILADGCNKSFQTMVSNMNEQYGMDIRFEEISK